MSEKLSLKDDHELLIDCSCGAEILAFGYLKDFDEFYLRILRSYAFKRKKEVAEITFKVEQAQQIIDFLQKNLEAKPNEY